MFTAAQNEAMIRSTGGVPVSLGSGSTWGHLDVADEALFHEAQVYGVKRTVRIATGMLAGVAQGATVSVGGEPYRVVGPPQRLEDGGITLLPLGAPQ